MNEYIAELLFLFFAPFLAEDVNAKSGVEYLGLHWKGELPLLQMVELGLQKLLKPPRPGEKSPHSPKLAL